MSSTSNYNNSNSWNSNYYNNIVSSSCTYSSVNSYVNNENRYSYSAVSHSRDHSQNGWNIVAPQTSIISYGNIARIDSPV